MHEVSNAVLRADVAQGSAHLRLREYLRINPQGWRAVPCRTGAGGWRGRLSDQIHLALQPIARAVGAVDELVVGV